MVLLESGRAQEAIPYFTDVQNVYPEDLMNAYALAQAHWRAGHKQISIGCSKTSTEITPIFNRHPNFKRDQIAAIDVADCIC